MFNTPNRRARLDESSQLEVFVIHKTKLYLLKKLDIYIIKKYLSTFVFTILMITMIAIAIDFFEKVDKFLKDTVTINEIIFDYYLNSMDKRSPLAVVCIISSYIFYIKVSIGFGDHIYA